ncbi:hypothetical protein [Streptomyces sp. NPDC001781]
MAARGFLQVVPGRRVALNGVEWTVEEVHGQYGRLMLVDGGGHAETRSFRWLINHADLRLLPAVEGPGRPAPVSRQPRTLADLTEDQLERARLRAAHVLEAETGFREGHPVRALPGEPRPAYDPDRTTLTQRRHAKAAEMKAMPRPEAVRLGLQHLSFRTLERLSGLAGDSLLLACADGRWTRRRSGHRSVTEEVREAIFAVKAECGERARLSLAARHRFMHQYMRERFPAFPAEKIPFRWTFADVWEEWFGPWGARPRYGRTAQAAAEAGVSGRMVVHRPGQVLVLDSTPMPVKLRETVFGDAVTATLTLALDLYTHGLPAFRLTLQSDTSVDIAMLLRDVMLPLPMREGWGEDMEWPYAGVPADVIAEFTAQGRRPAVLRPGDGHHRPRRPLQKPRPGGGRAGDRLPDPARPGAAADRQVRGRASVPHDPDHALRAPAGLRRWRRRRPRGRPGTRCEPDTRAGRTRDRDLDRPGLAEPQTGRIRPELGTG